MTFLGVVLLSLIRTEQKTGYQSTHFNFLLVKHIESSKNIGTLVISMIKIY